MKSAVAWFAENHVAANLLMIFLLLAGAFTAMNMKIEVFPETELDIITITTEYSGASPAEVEEAILRRIEERVAGLAGIERIDSNARESLGTVTIEVMKDWDVKKLLDEVKSEVDRITTLPDEAEKPEVRSLRQDTVSSPECKQISFDPEPAYLSCGDFRKKSFISLPLFVLQCFFIF